MTDDEIILLRFQRAKLSHDFRQAFKIDIPEADQEYISALSALRLLEDPTLRALAEGVTTEIGLVDEKEIAEIREMKTRAELNLLERSFQIKHLYPAISQIVH